jgi:glycosyltransferase involved in cell wall biosynthesis
MTDSVVSVLVFARNAVTTIERTLHSICSQRNQRFELILLDGGSTDGTLEVIQKYRDRIAVLRTGPDGGPTHAINEGIRRASGDVICLLPADDWLEPDALSIVTEEFSKDPELEVLTCGARIARLADDGGIVVRAEYLNPSALAFTFSNILRNPLTCARFIRRTVYERLGGMNAGWTFADKEFLLRAYLADVKSKVRCELAFTFRQHGGSATNSGRPEMTMRMLRENIRLCRRYATVPNLSAVNRRALRHLHGGSSARLAAMLLIRGRFRDAWRTVRKAFRYNLTWPLNAAVWYVESAREKYRQARAS